MRVNGGKDGAHLSVSEGISEISTILLDMRELATQGTTDTLNGSRQFSTLSESRWALPTTMSRKPLGATRTAIWIAPSLVVNDGTGGTFQLGNDSDAADRLECDSKDMTIGAPVLNLTGISVNTRNGSQEALAKIDTAIDSVSREPGAVGAMMNRLEYTLNFIESAIESVTALESTLRDADQALGSHGPGTHADSGADEPDGDDQLAGAGADGHVTAGRLEGLSQRSRNMWIRPPRVRCPGGGRVTSSSLRSSSSRLEK